MHDYTWKGIMEEKMGQQRTGGRCIHRLKTWPQFFDAVACGVKGFEIRKDDRGFEVGDVLLLQEFDPYQGEGSYSGREVSRLVLYKLDATSFSGIEKGYCILGLGVLPQYALVEGGVIAQSIRYAIFPTPGDCQFNNFENCIHKKGPCRCPVGCEEENNVVTEFPADCPLEKMEGNPLGSDCEEKPGAKKSVRMKEFYRERAKH